MKTIDAKNPQPSNLSTPPASAAATAVAPVDSPAAPATPAAPANGSSGTPPAPAPVTAPPARRRRWLMIVGGVVVLAVGGYFLVPWLDTALHTVSTDDAYVNGHVTYVAVRVPGKVSKVLVDDNMRVKKGDLLVQLDKEPYQVQVSLKRAAVGVAEANLTAALAKARGLEALAYSQRWRLQSAEQQARNQVALLKARVAALRTREATLIRAKADYERGRELAPSGAMSKEDLDQRLAQLRIAEAAVVQSREEIYQVRASLGLPLEPASKDLAEAPRDITETYSDVRAAFSDLTQSMSELGLSLPSIKMTPSEAIAEFHRRDKDRDLDRILLDLLPKVPAVVQAEALLASARDDLAQAELNLRYTDVFSDIDGVVLSRNVNPGNNVLAGQSLMAVRSITEIWIDANFKETQLADLRIGQRVKVEVDMYGSRKEFEGRITGFTMGTGQTLSLLPPQNATGNFVKIVQRLPVRIELTDYDPAGAPLFVGLSVTPYVYYKEPPTGPNAGDVLQPPAVLPLRRGDK
jgi:membrane fusion protein, multidrug efflux system